MGEPQFIDFTRPDKPAATQSLLISIRGHKKEKSVRAALDTAVKSDPVRSLIEKCCAQASLPTRTLSHQLRSNIVKGLNVALNRYHQNRSFKPSADTQYIARISITPVAPTSMSLSTAVWVHQPGKDGKSGRSGDLGETSLDFRFFIQTVNEKQEAVDWTTLAPYNGFSRLTKTVGPPSVQYSWVDKERDPERRDPGLFGPPKSNGDS